MINNILLLLLSCLGLALAKYCYSSYTMNGNFCSYGCCGVYTDRCCDYEMSGGEIAGLVIGIITLIAIIVAVVICCRRRRAYLGHPVFVPQGAGTPGVTVVQSSSQQQNAMCSQFPQPMAYPQYPPSAPGYYAAGPPGYPASVPQGYPGTGQQGYPTAGQKEFGAMPQGQGYIGPYPGYQQPAPPPYQ